MTCGFRFFVGALAAAFVLVVSPAALGDGQPYQLVTPSWSWDCAGFIVETIDGTVNGCTPRPAGVNMIATGYAASSDGSVVFMADGDNTAPTGGDSGSIWLVKPDGSSVHLDDSPWDFDPTISYDGSEVVFARFDPTNGSSNIYSVHSDGSDLQLVVSGEDKNYLRLPSISPDASAIAYWCGPADNGWNVDGCGPLTDGSYRDSGAMRANVDGSNPRMIVIGGGDALAPVGPSAMSWSPDSRWLALDGLLGVDLGNNEWTAVAELFEYHTDGSDLFDNTDPTRQITHQPDSGLFPQFSPDGSQLLYSSSIDDHGNVGGFSYMIDVDGTNRHEVFLNPDPLTCVDGTCDGWTSYGEFIPTATPVPPPPLVDMTHITVPSVGALDVGSATSKLEAHNLTVGTVRYTYSATVGKNRVVSQSPVAGAVAHRTQKQGPPVNLVVSRGGVPSCLVPRVKGKSLRATKRSLTAGHCEVGAIKRAYSRTVKKGRVVAEKPGAGRKLRNRAKIALTVSKGKKR